MKKKLLTGMLAIAATLCLCFGITACNIDSEPETQGHEHAYTLVEAHNPTCTESGNVLYYTCTCGKFFDGEKREIEKAQTVVLAIGHDYKMTWTSSDNKNAQVVLTCQNDSTHVYRCDGAVVENRTEATCEVDGSIEYTVTVEYDNNTYSETHTEKIDKLNHNYATPKWTWAADKTSATLELICTNNAEHKIVIENVSISDEERPNACTIDVIYTATASYNGQTYSDTQTVTKEGSHTFGDYTQTEDGHTRSCSGCGKTESGLHTYENGKCSVCNYEHQNHSFDSYIKDENGHSYTCDVCHKTVSGGHNYEDGICVDCEYEHVGHTFGNYVSDEEGHSHTCSVCKKAESDVHSYADGKCSVCNYEHEAHSFGNYSANDDTHSHTCGVCHKTVTDKHEYVNGKCETCKHEHSAHKFGVYTSDESEHSHTCDICHKTVDGTHSYANGRCTVCEYEHKNHEYGSYTITDDKHLHTCTVCQKVESGNHTFENGKCSVCDYERENHTFGNYECTEETHTRVCGDCKKVESGQHVYVNGVCEICQYQHKNHEFENYTSDDEKHTHVCGVCHKAESGVHDYENGQCATCQHEHSEHQFGVYSSDDSQHYHTCDICHKQIAGEHSYANGKCLTCNHEHQKHSFDSYIKDEDGHTHTCNVCHKTEQESHNYVNGECLTCQYEHENHSFGAYTEKQPTCTENGYKERSCEVCHKVEHEELVASGHKYDKGVCTVCGDVQNWIAFKTLIADGETVYGKVSNNTDTFSFLNEIIVGDGISYTVSMDIQGSQTIPSKTSPVEIGDNIFYILASKGEDMKLFTVTVRRRPIYTLTFSTSGTAVESKQVEEDSAIQSVEETSKTGYTFVHWTLNDEEVTFPYTVRQDIHCTSDYNVTFTAVFSPNSYDVALDAAGGEVVGGNQSVTFNESYQLPVPTRTGYSFTGWYDGDSRLTNNNGASLSKWEYAEGKNLTAHWSANRYYLTVDKNIDGAGSVTGGGSFTYDSDVTVTATDYLGYIFSGWYSGGECVYEGNSYSFKMGLEQTLTAHWQLDPAMSDFVFTSDETTCTITGAKTNTATELNIPDYVTTVKTSAFDNCALLESITVAAGNENYESYAGILYNKSKTIIVCCPKGIRTITEFPESYTSIAISTFARCGNLTNIVIPATVTSIAIGAFWGCSSLESITLPFIGYNKNTSSDTYQYPFGCIFGTRQFDGATAVNQVYHGDSTGSTTSSTYYIPDSLKSVTITGGEIPYGAFYNCNGLESVTIGDNVTSIGGSAFYGCSGLGSVTIGDNVTLIGGSAFYGCSGLGSVTIGRKVTSIGDNAFSGCAELTSVIWNAEYCTSGGFKDLTNLRTVTFGENVEIIPEYAFSGCIGLTGTLVIPDKVTSIGGSAFYGCSGLESVTIGRKVITIGDNAFSGCAELTSVIWNAENCTSGGFKDLTKLQSVTFGENVEIIPEYTLSGCSGLKSVTIGESVTSIGYRAFWGCRSLTSITISGSVTYIGKGALEDCTSLGTVYWNATNCETAGYYSNMTYPIFKGCTALTTVNIGENVERIPSYAFYNCTSLTGVYITDLKAWCNIKFGNSSANPLEYAHKLYLNNNLVTEITADMLQGVTEIKDYVFYGYTNLESIIIPDSVTSIGWYAFEDCTSLGSINFGNDSKLETIGGRAFYNCTSLGSIEIPDSVTSIKDRAFYNCTSLTSITIPDSVTSIGNSVFYGCTSLGSITIPDSVTSIGSYAFENCTNLTSVTIGESVTSIGNSVFYGCTSLTTVYWNAINCETAGNSDYPIFKGCTALTTINIGENVERIPSYAFCECKNLESITIPGSVTSIGDSAFCNCTSLTTVYWNAINCETAGSGSNPIFGGCAALTAVYIGENVERIPSYAFYRCRSLTIITIPDSVTSIGSNAFYYCTSLGSINFGTDSKLETIGDDAFEYCKSLESVTIPASVTSIGSGAFEYCKSLESVTIPASVTSIGDRAFYNCTNLTSINFGNDSKLETIGDDAFEDCKSLGSITIPDSVTSIGSGAFQYCYSLESVTIGSSVTSIGWYAFEDCTSLTTVYWNATNCETAYDSIFYGCTALTTINIGENVERIPYAFSGCKSLESITIPGSVTSIGNGAFENCTSLTTVYWNATNCETAGSYNYQIFKGCTALTTVYIGGNVESIPEYAFNYCTSLTGVYITDFTAWCNIEFGNSTANPLCYAHNLYLNDEPVTKITADMLQGVTEIKDYAFRGCTSLESVTIPDSVTSIGEYAFSGCTNLGSINFGNDSKLETIGGSAFSGCKSLESITIPNSVTSIGDSAFYGCTSLTSITIPDSVTSIGGSAFYDCTNLTNVTIGSSVTSIGWSAFRDCESLGSITIPNSVTSIGNYAFENCTSLTGVYITDLKAWCNIEFDGYYANPLYYAHNLYLNDESVTKITADMLQGVTEIKDYAFYGYTSLKSITIPDSVTSIGSYAFENCKSLTSVTFKNTSGWKVSSYEDMRNAKDVTLGTPAQNADYLKNTYKNYYWKRKS